jgi:hypothetical protein
MKQMRKFKRRKLMSNEKIAKYLDDLRAFEKEQHKLKDILYKINIDIINFDNKAVDLLISMISEVSGISEENIEYYLYEMDCNTGHCYYENDKPVLFKSAIEFVEWIKSYDK